MFAKPLVLGGTSDRETDYNVGQTVRIWNPNISDLNGYPNPFNIDDPGDDPRR